MFKNKHEIKVREIELCTEKRLLEIKKLQKKEIRYWKWKHQNDDKDFLKNKIESIDLEFNYRILEIQKIQEMEINGGKTAVKKYAIIFDDYLRIKDKCLDTSVEIVKLKKGCAEFCDQIGISLVSFLFLVSCFFSSFDMAYYRKSNMWQIELFCSFPLFFIGLITIGLITARVVYGKLKLIRTERGLKKRIRQLDKILVSFNKLFNDSIVHCDQCGEKLYI